MQSGQSRNTCHCQRSPLSLSSTILFLFLSFILPTSSYAQLTTSQPSTNNAAPSTLSKSTLPSESAPSSSSNPPTQTQQDSPAAATSTHSSTLIQTGDRAFNYYFLLVAVFVILFFLCLLWFGRHKKRKAALMRSQSQRALARDVEGWRTRFRAGLGNNGVREEGREEGLDERGEAPPPYAPGEKPPSIRSREQRRRSIDGGRGEQMELRTMSAEHKPPGYRETARGTDETTGVGDIARPVTAVMASERFGSGRRLLVTTGGSSEA